MPTDLDLDHRHDFIEEQVYGTQVAALPSTSIVYIFPIFLCKLYSQGM